MSTDAVDSIILAELPPDPNTLPPGKKREQAKRLEDIVLTNMIHGPCGEANPNSSCMKDGRCSVGGGFPKKFSNCTILTEEGMRPIYKRRSPEQGGRVITIMRGSQNFKVDNSWVVPYNPYLLLRYNAHINVELCQNCGGVKYLLGYVHKGCDSQCAKTVVEGEERDEIEEYRNLRSIGSSEAAWTAFAFEVAKNYPAVTALRVHLEDQQLVTFNEGTEEVAAESPWNTELTAFFKHNEKNQGTSEEFLRYVDFPEKFVYIEKAREWKLRVKKSDTIGRVHSLSPASGDVFYLRMLLHHDHCKGKISFQDMLTLHIQGDPVMCESYKEVCLKLGLLQDDQEWDQALTEAAIVRYPSALRDMFVTILMFCEPSNPRKLFDTHWEEDKWYEDFKYTAENRRGQHRRQPSMEQLKTFVLIDIENRLQSWEKSLRDFNLPVPTKEELNLAMEVDADVFLPAIIREELDFDWNEMKELAEMRKGCYTAEQLAVYNLVMEKVTNGQSLYLFINARGGCGKSYLSNGILAAVRTSEPNGCVALAMATTGIAATVLTLGRTYHSRMKAPLSPTPEGVLAITSQSVLAGLIRRAKLLIIDEVTMLDRAHLEMLDRSLQDIIGVEQPFGGKIIILSGDFRQCLPVVPGANRGGITDRCINRSHLWSHFTVMELKLNKRANKSNNAAANAAIDKYDEWTVSIGDGTAPVVEGDNLIQLPEDLCVEIDPSKPQDGMAKFCEKIWPRLEENYMDISYLDGRAVLAPTNKKVDEINALVTEKIPGPGTVLLSADALTEQEDPFRFSVEYLNTLQPVGLPNHKLVLKPGQPLMLLRNINPKKGQCNGTRMVFTQLVSNRVLQCKIPGSNTPILIPRITLRPKEGQYGFEWARRQFPGSINILS